MRNNQRERDEQTVRIRRSVQSLAKFFASSVRCSDRSASSRAVEIKSRLVPVSPLMKERKFWDCVTNLSTE